MDLQDSTFYVCGIVAVALAAIVVVALIYLISRRAIEEDKKLSPRSRNPYQREPSIFDLE